MTCFKLFSHSYIVEMDCFWCINNRGTNSKALEKLCSAEITEQLTFNMKKDLTDCYDCVLAYHNAKHLFLCDHENTWKVCLNRKVGITVS